MCDVKLEIPFQKQELKLEQQFPSKKLSIPYKDPTTFENVELKTSALSKSYWTGNATFEVVGDICKEEDYLDFNGILKIEQYKSGPLETKGGVVQFKRLFFHFRDLEIPIHVKYYYDTETICEEKPQINKSYNFYTLLQSTDVSQNVIPPNGIVPQINPKSDSTFKFTRFFVTNSDNESNMNPLFNNLEPEFKRLDSSFNAFYQFIATELNETKFASQITTELNRIICSPKTTEENMKNSYILYNEKIHHLKELNIYSLIRNKYN